MGARSLVGPDLASAERWKPHFQTGEAVPARALSASRAAARLRRSSRTSWIKGNIHKYLLASILAGRGLAVCLLVASLVAAVAAAGEGPRRASIAAIVNAASNLPGAISPGEIVVVWGEDLGPAGVTTLTVGPNGLVSTELGGTRILFHGVPAPLLYVSEHQASCVVPYAAGGMRSVLVSVERHGVVSPTVEAQVTQSVPGVFTTDFSGTGQAAAVNQDYSLNGPENPAMAGSAVTVYVTGEGRTVPPGVDGKPAAEPYPRPELPVEAEIGGLAAKVEYAGGAPGYVAGLMQVNLTIPAGVQPGGAVPFRVKIGDHWSQQGPTLAIAPGPSVDGAMYPIELDFDRLTGAPDFSFLNQPLTAASRVFVCGEHFCQVGPDLRPGTADDERVRFFGVNMSFGGNFPAAADGARVAKRLRRLGVNLVRLHHMDSAYRWARPEQAESILTDGPYPTLNAEAATRLRAFLDALKQEGIHVNLNIHVGFEFRPEIDGVPALPGADMPEQSKPLHAIHPRMIELQEEFARQVIRALSLKDDPVLAMVEISNEASILRSWQTGGLDEVLLGEYRTSLEERWNGYLRAKYGSTEALRAAWGGGGAEGPNLLGGTWRNEQHAPARATLTEITTDGVPTAQVVVHQGGNWINIKRVGFSVDPAKTYAARVEVRADLAAGEVREVSWGIKEDVSPWRTQLSRSIQVSNQWRTYEMVLRPPFAMNGTGRFYLDVQNMAGATIDIRNESLREASVGLRDGESIEQANVGLVDGSRPASDPQTEDYLSFLAAQDAAYLERILAVIRAETDGLTPVSGTQVNWGGGPIAYDSQRGLDYQDAHFYVDHYNFPGASWDSRDWRIRDSAFTDGLEELRDTAVLRESGRPFTVSEYNQPWPNRQAAEIDPVLAAHAAFQNWDAVMHYSYSHSHHYDHGLPSGFDLIFDLTKLPVIGQSAWMFRTAAVSKGAQPLEIPIGRRQRINAAISDRVWEMAALIEELLGIDADVVFRHRIRMAPSEEGVIPESARQALARPIVSDTGEFTCDPERGLFLVHSRFAAAVAGRIGDAEVEAGAIRVQLASGQRGFAVLVVTPADGKPLEETRRWLIATPGYTLGSKPGVDPPAPLAMVPYRGQSGWWTLEPDRPGKPSSPYSASALPVWMERVESRLTLRTGAGSLRVYPLDGSGRRMAALTASDVEKVDGGFRIHLQAPGQRFSPWYEAEGR